MLTTSCEDMLTPDMDRYATEDAFGADSVYSALGILRSIQNVAERTVIIDACRSDLVTSGTYTTDSISEIMNFNDPENGSSGLVNVADFYHVVNSCNFYLANVDTTITQNSQQLMLREWAQVQAMRAWAYIQLVRIYGEVPFVTTPIGSTDEASEALQTATRTNASNLASLLVENGLTRAYEVQRLYGMPSYESFNNGTVTFNSTLNFYPVELVMADAYLMADDYASAAQYYWQHFMYNNSAVPTFFNDTYCGGSDEQGGSEPTVNSGDIISPFQDITTDDAITLVVGASNSSYGKTLNQLQNVFGFETTVSGSTSVTPNEQYLQISPSSQYITLNRAQRYNLYEQEGEVYTISEAQTGDARLLAYAPEMTFANGSSTRIIDKYAATSQNNVRDGQRIRYNQFEMTYHIPMYRSPVVLLSYAEAINRLGFPELAFGILKDGIISQNLPTYGTIDIVRETTQIVQTYDAVNDTIVNDTVAGIQVGKVSLGTSSATVDYTADSTRVVYGDRYVGNFIPYEAHDSIPGTAVSDIPEDVQNSWYGVEYLLEPTAFSGGMYYLSMEEAKDMNNYSFLDFSNSLWSETDATNEYKNYGIHARGCGDVAGIYDTVYTYARQVAERIAQDEARTRGLSYAEQQAYAKTLYSGDTLYVTDKDLIINAVENIIVDEMALEACFENSRYASLVRIAGHKNNAGQDGTAWLAWKIARRDKNFTDDASVVDASLQSKLLNTSNWYLTLPEE